VFTGGIMLAPDGHRYGLLIHCPAGGALSGAAIVASNWNKCWPGIQTSSCPRSSQRSPVGGLVNGGTLRVLCTGYHAVLIMTASRGISWSMHSA
jgi:hypothetical protein